VYKVYVISASIFSVWLNGDLNVDGCICCF